MQVDEPDTTVMEVCVLGFFQLPLWDLDQGCLQRSSVDSKKNMVVTKIDCNLFYHVVNCEWWD